MACNGMASSFFPPNFLLQMQTPHEEDHSSSNYHPQLLPPAPHDYQAVAALLGRRSMSFSGLEACEEVNGEDELSDDCSQAGEKKRRLNVEQVKTLEKNFELGNKLEPGRKMQLARALGLQPRQIAIWFQNRRARWKTKQLEKDYDLLKKQFEALKFENEALQAHNKKLQAEMMALRGREMPEPINLNKETEGSCSNRSDNSSDINLDISQAPTDPHRPLFFQSSRPPPGITHTPIFLGTSRPDLLSPKIEHGSAVQDESFCNMFCSLEDQSGFWTTWHEHQNFH